MRDVTLVILNSLRIKEAFKFSKINIISCGA